MAGPMGLVYENPGDPSTADVWGTALNLSLSTIEQHTHEPGKGSLVPSAGLGINADTNWAGYALALAKAITFNEVAASAMVPYSDALFVDSSTHNLFFRNNSGSNVQLTNGSSIAFQLVGGLTLDYGAVGASFGFDDSTKRYLAQSEGSPRPWSGLATADIDLYEKALIAGSPAANKVTLKSPHALAASYSVTWLAALPGATSALQLSSTGVMTASNTFATLITAPDYKWSSTRDVPVPLQPVAKLVTNTAYDGDGISLDSSGTSWDARTLVLSGIRSGDRIVGAVTTSSFTGTMQLRIDKINAGSASSTGCTINVTTGFTQVGTFSSPYTVGANESVYIDISGSATGAVLKQLTLQVDRP